MGRLTQMSKYSFYLYEPLLEEISAWSRVKATVNHELFLVINPKTYPISTDNKIHW